MKRFFPVFMVPLTALVLSAGMTAQGGAPFNADDRDENESRSFKKRSKTTRSRRKHSCGSTWHGSKPSRAR